MKALDLYKFIIDYDIEYHWHDDDVIMFVNNRDIPFFHTILPASIFDDSGIDCVMKDGYFCFMMKDLCEWSGIELTEIFSIVEK